MQEHHELIHDAPFLTVHKGRNCLGVKPEEVKGTLMMEETKSILSSRAS